jgi:DNA-binding NarL/FixJ family response regulator
MSDLELDFDTEINLYRLIQEGLNNIKKHAEAFQAGATGYVIKESAAEGLLKGIETVLKGDYFLDSAVSSQVVQTLMKLPGKETRITDAHYASHIISGFIDPL